MAEFKAKDFENLLYPVHTLKKGVDLFKSLPELLDHDEFSKAKIPPALELNKVFKYIVYVYDSKSPYVTQIDNLRERKIEAAKDAGFSTTHNLGFSNSVIAMLNCEYDSINKMIIRYLRMQGKDITGLAVDQEAYYELNLQILKGLTGSEQDKAEQAQKKAKLSKDKDEMRKRIEENAREFLQEESAKELHKTLWIIAEDEIKNILLTPEDYAEEL